MNRIFLGKPSARIERWIKAHSPVQPDPTTGGIWYIINGTSSGGWLTKGNMLSYDAANKIWKSGNAKILFESHWKGLNNSTVEIIFDQNFNYAKTLTKGEITVANWYQSTTDIPTWMLGGNWKLDDVVRTTAFSDTPEYSFWGNDNYHIRWDKVNKVWSGKRNGRTMKNISTTSESAKTFTYTTSAGSFTANWSAS